MAEKTVKEKQPEKAKQSESSVRGGKAKLFQKPQTDDKGEKTTKPNALAQWWRETMGELRKVNWPTKEDAWRLTKIVLIVMGIMAVTLGLLDYLFSYLIRLLVA